MDLHFMQHSYWIVHQVVTQCYITQSLLALTLITAGVGQPGESQRWGPTWLDYACLDFNWRGAPSACLHIAHGLGGHEWTLELGLGGHIFD